MQLLNTCFWMEITSEEAIYDGYIFYINFYYNHLGVNLQDYYTTESYNTWKAI